MSIIRVSKTPNQFSIIDRTPAEDPRLSFKAKGIMFYLLTKPDDWTIRVKDLINHSTDGRDSIYNGIKELEEKGYIERKPLKGEDGRYRGYEYIVYENPIISPHTENTDTVKNAENSPHTENPEAVKQDTEKAYISNTNINDNKEDEEEGKIIEIESISISEKEFQKHIKKNRIPTHIANSIQEQLREKHYGLITDYSPEAIRRTFRKMSNRIQNIGNMAAWFVTTLINENYVIEQERAAIDQMAASKEKYGF